LLAVQEVVLATIAVLRGESQPADYNQGFEDALRCMAASFGVRVLTEGNCSLGKASASPGGPFWLHEDIEEKLL
ncbi:MAG: hypothetical protein GTO63_10085, partial [Anaerolineae bacterium]|nr:hypothetical protein [Anaerolineae bacterium]NIN95249.1 hypothetical protein [Anaerolineae bacterium]NIQ78215.1 hypothetical protein [Anaerolineae bacterium]